MQARVTLPWGGTGRSYTQRMEWTVNTFDWLSWECIWWWMAVSWTNCRNVDKYFWQRKSNRSQELILLNHSQVTSLLSFRGKHVKAPVTIAALHITGKLFEGACELSTFWTSEWWACLLKWALSQCPRMRKQFLRRRVGERWESPPRMQEIKL